MDPQKKKINVFVILKMIKKNINTLMECQKEEENVSVILKEIIEKLIALKECTRDPRTDNKRKVIALVEQ